jgi:PPK2 family polyphosphate:nucleotide phosphotransferase
VHKTIDHADLLAKPGHDIDLTRYDPAFTADFRDKHDAREKLEGDVKKLSALQDVFYADGGYALLIVFQGMDAAGKDGAIRHVMSAVSPQGIDVCPFKQPSSAELSHDYLWRCGKVLPERGRFAVFNRSYYEELTVVRVHRSLLVLERLPTQPSDRNVWKERYQDVNAFERHLIRNGTIVIKFFLHVSKEEQRKRLLERIDVPEKNWKISPADIHERTFWENYRRAYEQLLTHTSTEEAPWYVIPADHKWFTRAAVADVIVSRLKTLGAAYPVLSDDAAAKLATEGVRLAQESDLGSSPQPALAAAGTVAAHD